MRITGFCARAWISAVYPAAIDTITRESIRRLLIGTFGNRAALFRVTIGAIGTVGTLAQAITE